MTVLRENTYGDNSSRLEIWLERRNEGLYFCDPSNSVGLGKPCRIDVAIPVASSTFLSSSDMIVALAVSSVLVMVICISGCYIIQKMPKERKGILY